jgi:membrane-associated PAP2 superfamily phosphatase
MPPVASRRSSDPASISSAGRSEAFVSALANRRFVVAHFWLPLSAFIVLTLVLMPGQGDLWIADRLYALQGNRWAFRHAFLTDTVIHLVGRDLSLVAWLAVVAAWLVARTRADLQLWRGPLAYLAVSTLLATAVIAWIKSWSNMDCPWDLLRYGGERPYVGLLGLRPVGLSRGACFPAGHASAGYAWLSLYFFFRATRPRLRWIGLLAGATAGLVFGVSQQLRGAHFLSHDVWTAALCWMVAFALSLLPWTRQAPARTRSDLPAAVVSG